MQLFHFRHTSKYGCVSGVADSEEHPVPARLASGLKDFSHMEDDVDRQRLLGSRGAGDPATAVISQQLCKKERSVHGRRRLDSRQRQNVL